MSRAVLLYLIKKYNNLYFVSVCVKITHVKNNKYMKIKNTQDNRSYLITNTHRGFDVTYLTSLPRSKRAKKLTLIVNGKSKLELNGHQINTLRRVFAKENLINGAAN
jgi:hypothetical protein